MRWEVASSANEKESERGEEGNMCSELLTAISLAHQVHTKKVRLHKTLLTQNAKSSSSSPSSQHCSISLSLSPLSRTRLYTRAAILINEAAFPLVNLHLNNANSTCTVYTMSARVHHLLPLTYYVYIYNPFTTIDCFG